MATTLGRMLGALALATAIGAGAERAEAAPDFDGVGWTPIGCPAAKLTVDASPSSVNFVGDPTYPAAYYAYDADYLYFRYRMDGNPSGPGGFAQYTWTALMQVPSGNPFQYQYQLSLEGGNDAIEIWANTTASDIDFSPLFKDDSEVRLVTQPYTTDSLARSLVAGDGSSFGGNPDWFVDFAFPVATLVSQGVVADVAGVASSFFFPATSTNANNYNKGRLNCSFLPTTELVIDKAAEPSTLPANAATPLVYTIAVANDGPGAARGLVVEDIALPAWMTGVDATVAADDATVTWTVVSTNPLQVRVPLLPPGATVSVQLAATAAPTCSELEFMNVANAFATNALDDADTALVTVEHDPSGAELCDGADNDCDGQVDEGASAACDDGDLCNGAETCGAGACQAGTPPSCDDGDACTTDSCGAGACQHAALPGCVACATDADCGDDGDACTDETCIDGACAAPPIVGCEPCVADGDCTDADACTADVCAAGICQHDATPGCVACATDADCGDANACTTETCAAGVCQQAALPGCVPCTTAADCGDADACSDDLCSAGVCEHAPRPGCVPCASDAECTDGDACTTDVCAADGSCAFTEVPGCVACATEADCDDGDRCTTDSCTAGVCGHTEIEECREPLPENEVCGNCLDDDADGLADYEDPDCCAADLELGLQKGMLKARKAGGTRFRLKTRYAAVAPATFDPMTQDTTLQISDRAGQLFCHTVAAPAWKHPRKRVFKFKDKRGLLAGGLKRGVFKLRKDGSIRFRTNGKRMDLRAPDGSPLLITLRVGDQCAHATTAVRSKRKALVFP